MQPAASSRVTQLLQATVAGSPQAAEELMPLVYEELRALAASFLGSANPNHTLQPTALVHEAYLKLVRVADDQWSGRRHFFEVAAKAMRQVLANHARDRRRLKRGGEAHRVTLCDDHPDTRQHDESIVSTLDLEDALASLETSSPELARVVELRYFAGLSLEEIGQSLGTPTRTLERQWRLAKAELKLRLSEGPGEQDS